MPDNTHNIVVHVTACVNTVSVIGHQTCLQYKVSVILDVSMTLSRTIFAVIFYV